jgi:hypothetical protein
LPHGGALLPGIRGWCEGHGHGEPDPVPEVCPHCHMERADTWAMDDPGWLLSIDRCGMKE